MKEALKTAWTYIHRSPYQSLAASITMFLTFFLASLMILVAVGSQVVLHYFETRPQVTAFFKESITAESSVDGLKEKLQQTGKVKEMKIVSKEEALSINREQNKNDPLLLEMVTANILPASLEVATTDLSYLGEVADIMRKDSGVEEVIFQEDVVQNLKVWTQAIREIGIALVGCLGLVSILIVLIIIGLKIAAKKEEIDILRLIGASSGYVKLPFLLEGIFYGLVGAVSAWVAVYLVLLYSTPLLLQFLSGIPILPIPILLMLKLLAAEVLSGILIGILGSTLALKRYLR